MRVFDPIVGLSKRPPKRRIRERLAAIGAGAVLTAASQGTALAFSDSTFADADWSVARTVAAGLHLLSAPWRCSGRGAIGLLAVLLVLHARTALAVAVVADTDLADSNWSAAVLADATAGGLLFTAAQSASGGNPGAYRQITHVYTGPGGFNIGHFYESASYDPAVSGALQSVDISFDDAFFNYPGEGGVAPFAVAIFPAVRQGGVVFDGPYSITTSPAWVRQEFDGLTVSDFSGVDFSSAGAPLFFGFVSGNGSAFGGQTTTVSGVDNFVVTAHPVTVPEPRPMALILMGLLTLRFFAQRTMFRMPDGRAR